MIRFEMYFPIVHPGPFFYRLPLVQPPLCDFGMDHPVLTLLKHTATLLRLHQYVQYTFIVSSTPKTNRVIILVSYGILNTEYWLIADPSRRFVVTSF